MLAGVLAAQGAAGGDCQPCWQIGREGRGHSVRFLHSQERIKLDVPGQCISCGSTFADQRPQGNHPQMTLSDGLDPVKQH